MSTTTDIDLTPFCDTAISRYSLAEPFVQRGYLVATDGMKLACVPTSEPDTTGRKVPNVHEIIRHRASGELVDWPAASYSEKVLTCRRCTGNGAAHTRDCERCDGNGMIECDHCGSDVECDACDGEGTVECGKCPTCKGAREALQPYAIEVGGRLLAYKNDLAIRSLPGVRFVDDGKRDEMLWFEFAGGFGGVMHLARDQ